MNDFAHVSADGKTKLSAIMNEPEKNNIEQTSNWAKKSKFSFVEDNLYCCKHYKGRKKCRIGRVDVIHHGEFLAAVKDNCC